MSMITLPERLFLEMLQNMDLPKAIPFLCQIKTSQTVSISEIMDCLQCNLKTLSNVLPKLCKAGIITMIGSSIRLASVHDRISDEPSNEPTPSQDQTDEQTKIVPISSQDRPNIIPASGRAVQDEETDSPSHTSARIGVSLSSLGSKDSSKTRTSNTNQKQIQTPREEKKSRVSKTEPDEIPLELPTDLAALVGVVEAWSAYEMMRQRHKKNKKPSNFARNRLWNALRKFHAEGHDLVEIIAKSEDKGWTDFYRPDPPPSVAATEKPKARATDFRDNMRADVQRARLNRELGITDDDLDDQTIEISRILEDEK